MDAYFDGDTARARRWAARLGGARPESRDADLRTLLRAVDEAEAGRYQAAIATSEPLLAVQAVAVQLEGSASADASLGDPFARAALHLKRGEWFRAIADIDSAEREWLWYEAEDIAGFPAASLPQAGEIDWALGTLGRYQRGIAALGGGELEAACRHLSRVAALWSDADPGIAALGREAREGAGKACGAGDA
jgi:hypothetical protein